MPRASETPAGTLRAPASLRSFNRYEIKYLVDTADLARLREELSQRLDPDRNGDSDDGGYGVWSLYYDTPALRFYWEKIEGFRFRRKLRIRHYGDRLAVNDETPVYVEIKQRVNRVTQKRRVRLSYQAARTLCDGRQLVEHEPQDRGFVEEVLGLVNGLDLRPTTITGYHRQAYQGRGAEVGLRVTIDQRIRGRDRDFDLAAEGENRLIVPARRTIVEIKANERVPYWVTDLTAALNLTIVRVSKYCQSVEAFGRAPRSVFHVPDHENEPTPTPVHDPAED